MRGITTPFEALDTAAPTDIVSLENIVASKLVSRHETDAGEGLAPFQRPEETRDGPVFGRKPRHPDVGVGRGRTRT